ncbi:hypothetical protein Y032_0093g2626 [Ancylostoma ceylanicum]|uniref:Uncharacterized protein n=1 Tax=Ancylostoma ceylanicum TaxID=53326 RepID=A0A016TLU0_9BILA|nr:hypothetical protein Y032_0093g2626 [Ancylostoma ceylanicum]
MCTRIKAHDSGDFKPVLGQRIAAVQQQHRVLTSKRSRKSLTVTVPRTNKHAITAKDTRTADRYYSRRYREYEMKAIAFTMRAINS